MQQGYLAQLFAGAMTGLAALSPAAQAQSTHYGPGTQRFTEIFFSAHKDPVFVHAACPPLSPELVSLQKAFGTTDQVCIATTQSIGFAAGKQFFFTHYQLTSRSAELDIDSGVIVQQTGTKKPVQIAHIPYQAERRMDVRVHDVKGLAVIGVETCPKNNGGCIEELYLLTASGQARPLQADESWANMYARIPERYQTTKSPLPNFRTMSWQRNLATDGNANGSAAATLDIDFSLQGDTLHVDRFILTGPSAVIPLPRP